LLAVEKNKQLKFILDSSWQSEQGKKSAKIKTKKQLFYDSKWKSGAN
jgi:hypothetical protein